MDVVPPWCSLAWAPTPSRRACYVPFCPSSGKSSDRTSSSLGRLTSMTTPATMNNSFRSTTRSLRLQEVMIGWRSTIYPRLYPVWPDLGSSIYLEEPSTIGTNYVTCSSTTSRVHMSIRSPLRPWRTSSRSLVRTSEITWNISAIPGRLSWTSRTSRSSMSSMKGSVTSRPLKRLPWRSQKLWVI
jgi:hypothetical protein